MTTTGRFSASAPQGEPPDILSVQSLAGVIDEIMALPDDLEDEFDEESVNNAVRLCEKLDVSFDKLSAEEKWLVLSNYKFLTNKNEFIIFLKLMFRGGIETKEVVFRTLFHKLKASEVVTHSILDTYSLFENSEIKNSVQEGFSSLINTILKGFLDLVPSKYYIDKVESEITVTLFESILKNENRIFDERWISYSEIVKNFGNLLHIIFSNEYLSLYFEWRDRYLRYWLVEILRMKDREDNNPAPKLNTIKADLYVEYMNWTKIARRLNANLRHKNSYCNNTTIKAESIMLQRLPSNIISELVFKIQNKIPKNKADKVKLPVKESFINEEELIKELADEIIKEEEKAGRKSSLLKSLVEEIKKIFSLADSNKDEQKDVEIIPRLYPQELIPTVRVNYMSYGPQFPNDYPGDYPKLITKFFSSYLKNHLLEFEVTVKEILKVYADNDSKAVVVSPHRMNLQGSQMAIDFQEKCIVFSIEEVFLLMLGVTCFCETKKEYQDHPEPFPYLKWFKPADFPTRDSIYVSGDSEPYEVTPPENFSDYKLDIQVGLIQIIDSLPDSSRSKPEIMSLLKFLNENNG